MIIKILSKGDYLGSLFSMIQPDNEVKGLILKPYLGCEVCATIFWVLTYEVFMICPLIAMALFATYWLLIALLKEVAVIVPFITLFACVVFFKASFEVLFHPFIAGFVTYIIVLLIDKIEG